MKSKLTKPKLIVSRRDTYIPSIRFYTKRVNSSTLLATISRIINKYFYNLGLGSVLNRYNNSITLYSTFSDKKLYKAYAKNSLFCNFGSGAFYHSKWKNYDYSGKSNSYKSIQGKLNVDFTHIDLNDKNLVIPEKDKSVSLIYCSHTLEHLEFSSVKRFMSECFRILKTDGVLRIVLPTSKKDFNIINYINNQLNVDSELIESFMLDAGSNLLNDIKSKLSINEIYELFKKSNFDAKTFYSLFKNFKNASKFDREHPERHISFLDYNQLISISNKLGFKMCIPLYQNSSFAQPFKNNIVFDTTEPHMSFYADIVK